ncbi:hypothetical protein ACU686_11300 [Yinghuangia aomiensis]
MGRPAGGRHRPAGALLRRGPRRVDAVPVDGAILGETSYRDWLQRSGA